MLRIFSLKLRKLHARASGEQPTRMTPPKKSLHFLLLILLRIYRRLFTLRGAGTERISALFFSQIRAVETKVSKSQSLFILKQT